MSNTRDVVHYKLQQLSDVEADGIAPGQGLAWNGSKFVPTILGGGGSSGEAASTFVVVPNNAPAALNLFTPNMVQAFDAYRAPDMPTSLAGSGNNASKNYYTGFSAGYSAGPTTITRGIQLATGWNGETGDPLGTFVRAKDDTHTDWGTWRRLAYADELGTGGAAGDYTAGTAGSGTCVLNDTVYATLWNTSFAKYAEYRCPVGGTITTSLGIQGMPQSEARIYVNGVARGAVRYGSSGLDPQGNPTYDTENITVVAGDLLQVYHRHQFNTNGAPVPIKLLVYTGQTTGFALMGSNALANIIIPYPYFPPS